MQYRAIKTAPADNVAIAVQPVPVSSRVVVADYGELTANQEIPLGHKIALVDIPAGSGVIRYGEAICQAAGDIKTGDWVHVHNTVSCA